MESFEINADSYSKKISQKEKETCLSLLSHSSSLENSSFFQNAYKRVSDLSKWVTGKKFLMVGMGPLPMTMFYVIDKNLVQEAIGIDNDEEAVNLATKISHQLNKKNLSFYHHTGENFNYYDYDTIFIANLVKNKGEVLKKILKQIDEKTLVILREPWGKGTKLSEQGYFPSDKESWTILGQGEKCPHFFSQNLYLRKKI